MKFNKFNTRSSEKREMTAILAQQHSRGQAHVLIVFLESLPLGYSFLKQECEIREGEEEGNLNKTGKKREVKEEKKKRTLVWAERSAMPVWWVKWRFLPASAEADRSQAESH